MPTPICTLRTQRPTPTTASFVVSTASHIESFSGQFLHYVLLFLRFLLASNILLILAVKWDELYATPGKQWLPDGIYQYPPGWFSMLVAQSMPTIYLVPISLVCLWLLVQRGYTGMVLQMLAIQSLPGIEESLLVLRGLGIQTTSSASTYLTTAATRFIPTTAIQDIFIHEAFKGFEVRFYLAIVVEGEEDVVVIFPVWISVRVFQS
jgi:phosphatidylinositol N-acetylglucosaminyltransferase subunit H